MSTGDPHDPPLPNMKEGRQALMAFFSSALSSFQSSGARFQVICTVTRPTRRHDDAAQLPAPAPPLVRPRALVVLDSSFNPPTTAHQRMVRHALGDLTEFNQGSLGAVRVLLLLAVNNADKAPKPAPFDQRLAMMWAFAKDIQNSLPVKDTSGQQDGVEQEPRHLQQHTKDQQDGLNIDVALSTQPYFHQKSEAIAESDFYKRQQGDEDGMEQVILTGYDTLIRILNPKYYGPPTWIAQVVSPSTTAAGRVTKPPIQEALDPFFARAKLRVTMRTDDEWGGKEDQLAYVRDISTGKGLSKIGGSKEWGGRIDMVEGRAAGEDIVSSTYAREAANACDWNKLGRMVSPSVRAWIEMNSLYQ